MRDRAAIVLAAGKGKRMKSDLPKVLHLIHGRPMITILMDTLVKLHFSKLVVVIGFKGELVEKSLAGYPVSLVWQRQQLGTGHAVEMTRPILGEFEGTTLVALGDVPFLSAASIERLFDIHRRTKAAATCLSAVIDEPAGYGRIVREGDTDILKEIVEDKEASDQVRRIREINTGTFCFDNQHLFSALREVDNSNVQREYYLTDTINILRRNKLAAAVVTADNADEVLGINSVEQLEILARKFAGLAGSR
ncbi:MAG TPA: NTP transferase domain-containing protein [Candidatus Deferrimicrobium sp.]|nr:NTP transferase domain-containing protein [Candidatus Deferrimicrobium sp.]